MKRIFLGSLFLVAISLTNLHGQETTSRRPWPVLRLVREDWKLRRRLRNRPLRQPLHQVPNWQKPLKRTRLRPMDKNQKEVAVLKTSDGEMVVEFWPEVAPKTVENFKKLAREGFYDGTAFPSHHQGLHDPGRRPEHEGSHERKHATARAARATRSRPSSTSVRTFAASSRWRARPIPIPPAASSSSASARPARSTANTPPSAISSKASTCSIRSATRR